MRYKDKDVELPVISTARKLPTPISIAIGVICGLMFARFFSGGVCFLFRIYVFAVSEI